MARRAITGAAAGLALLTSVSVGGLVSPAGASGSLQVVTSSLPNATVRTFYRQQLAATGGATPYVWSWTPSVPGLSLTSGGLISGVPNTVGTFSFTVTVTGAGGHQAARSLQLAVQKIPTTTTATATPNQVSSGSPVTFAATVTGASTMNSGTVSFRVGTLGLCSAAVSGGQASCAADNAPNGSDTVTAAFSGTPDLAHSTTSVALTVVSEPTDWTELHHDPQLSGLSGDTTISAANGSTLGVNWMADTGAAALSSPVEAWNAALGKNLVYIGNESGYFVAYDEATGIPVWSVQLGKAVRTSPLVEGGNVWVASTGSGRLYKLNGATGATMCSAPITNAANETIDASPVIATPPGGQATVYIGANDIGSFNGPITAVNESTCTVRFSVTPEPQAGTGGTWDPLSYGVNATGEPLILFGTSDPDSAVYALDAVTGSTVWRYAVDNPPPGIFDIGAGVTVSPPGTNGISDGAAYVESKFGILYALDLTTGTVLWQYSATKVIGLATPALSGTDLIVGDHAGVDDFDPVTGAHKWLFSDASGFDASPAVVGPVGSQVVIDADLAGRVVVLSLATGALIATYQTGGYVTSSPGDANGHILEASSDGFLYDLSVNGDTASPPSTTVESPVDGSTVANPSGPLTISGSTQGASPIGAVKVAIQQSGGTGRWWDSATQTWTTAPYPNPAVLNAPNTTSTNWSVTVPVPSGGNQLEVFASAVNEAGSADRSAVQSQPTQARATFTVSPAPNAPTVTPSSPFVAPRIPFQVSASGFAPGEQVDFAVGGTFVGSALASAAGSVTNALVKVPPTVAFGPEGIRATGQVSGAFTTAPIYVTNSWAQQGQGMDQTSSEDNDTVFANQVSVNPNGLLTAAWSFDMAGSVAGSVVVSDGLAYAADSTGTVVAIKIASGRQVWSTSDGGASITTTPAVFGGNVYITTSSGQLICLNASTGTLLWSRSISTTALSSPTVAPANVLVTSQDGILHSVDPQTGAPNWSASLGTTSSSDPAVDPSSQRILVGDDGGTIHAFSMTGSALWTASLGGKVQSAPAILNGLAYVGSGNGQVYALDAGTGSTRWTFQTGGPITASPAVDPALVVVGSSDGNDYYLDPKTGTQVYNPIAFGAAVVGVASTGSFTVSSASSGHVIASKPAADDPWAWQTMVSGGLTATPTIVNGEVFLPAPSGVVTCYTLSGQAPV